MKKLLALVLALVMLFGLVACSGGGDKDDKKGSDGPVTLNVGVTAIPDTFDPFAASSGGRWNVIPTVYQPLVETDQETGKARGILVESMEKPEPTVWRLKLYEDIYDTAGNHFTASDAVFSITKTQEAAKLSIIRMIDHAEVVDEFTLDVYCNTELEHQFSQGLAMVWMVTEKAFNDSPDQMATDPVGTTGYVLTEFNSGANVSFKKADKYWGAGKSAPWFEPNVDVVNFELIKESAQLTIALQTGQVDFVPLIPATEFENFADEDGYTAVALQEYTPGTLFFNCKEGYACSDVKLRQAIAYAIDAEAIIKTALGGYGELCTSFGVSNFSDAGDDWEVPYKQDLAKAKELLDASGYDTGKKLKLMVENIAERKKVCEIIQAQLGEIGLDVELAIFDTAAYTTNRTEPDVWDIRLDYKSNATMLDLWMDWISANREGGDNWMFFKDDKLQAMLENINCEENFGDYDLMTEAKDYINENVYGYSLYSTTAFFVAEDNVDFTNGYNAKQKPAPGACVVS